MDPQKQGTHSGGADTYRSHMETGTIVEGRQRHKNHVNAKTTPADNTQNGDRQSNEDNIQKTCGRWVTKQTRNISINGKIVKINKNTRVQSW